MKTIYLLDLNDTFDMEDWCRPLYLTTDFTQSDEIHTTSLYSGSPQNNLKWTKVKNVFGDIWQGRQIGEYFEKHPMCPGLITYEFAKGDIPKDHIL